MPRTASIPTLTRNEKRAATKASRDRNDGRPLLTIPETAEYLRKSRSSVYRLIHSGELRVLRVGGVLRVRPSDVDAYLDRNVG